MHALSRVPPLAPLIALLDALDSPYSGESAELSRLAVGDGAVGVGTSIGNRAGVIGP